MDNRLNGNRITIFAGHYGSGKTSLAVNFALRLRERHERVAVCDLDIVNPYFRTSDASELLKSRGISLISSDYANTNAEAFSVPPGAAALFDDRSLRGVIDLGGDDRGALALGRYAERLSGAKDAAMLLVINMYRPLTRDIGSLTGVRDEIERAARFRFTGVINNSNLGAGTSAEDVRSSIRFAEEAAERLSLPLCFTAVRRGIAHELEDLRDIFPIDIFNKSEWRIWRSREEDHGKGDV